MIRSRLCRTWSLVWLVVFGILGAVPAFGQAVATPYGVVSFPISCNGAATDHFTHGLALLHHMMYGEAEARFGQAADADPACAMAHWGAAMSQLHPLWAPPTPAELERGLEAVRAARRQGADTARETAYITGIAAFFEKDGSFPERLGRWEEAQEALFERYPEDVDAAAFYALARLATAPADDPTFSRQEEVGALLEDRLQTAPRHPGLHHYLIHAYDNPVLAARAERVARDYGPLAPDVPHALHMPSHIFVRLGHWEEVADWNRRSAAAALRHSPEGQVSLHYGHAIDYMVYADLQHGREAQARRAAAELFGQPAHQSHLGSAYALAAVPARIALERRDWREAAELPVRHPASFDWSAYPAAEAITQFARGLGAAQIGDFNLARESVKRLGELAEQLNQDPYWGPAVEAQEMTVRAWILHEEGATDRALELMNEAADREESAGKHPVTPGAVRPARELLGEMALRLGRPAEALAAFEASLTRSPNRLNSLSGAGRSAELVGDWKRAGSYYARVTALLNDAESGAESSVPARGDRSE